MSEVRNEEITVKPDSAGRLLDLLLEAKARKNNERFCDVWAGIFGVPASDTGSVLSLVSQFIELNQKAKDDIRKLSDADHDLYLRPFNKIDSIFSRINFDEGWAAWKSQLDETLITELRFVSDKLKRNTSQTFINSGDVAQLLQQVTDLETEILESDLHEDVKRLLLQNLSQIRACLISYRISGPEAIKVEFQRSMGSLYLEKEQILRNSKSNDQKERAIWDKFLKVLAQFNTISGAYKNWQNLLADPGLQTLIAMLIPN